MTLSFEDIEYMNNNFESQVFDRKSLGILSHSVDLAELMVAFGNNKFVSEDFGGVILIGIKDDGEYEELEPDQGHEMTIMNIAQQNIYPPMTPSFEVVSDDEKNVYAITVPKMITIPYALKTRDGYVYKKRVGSTIRDALFEELEHLKKSNDGSKSKEERIEKNFPNSTNLPFIKLTIIPLDANRQLINFNKESTKWLKSKIPLNVHVREVTLKQNELHYESKTFPSTTSDWFVLNQYGEFSAMEIIQLYQESIVRIGRQTVFVMSILNFVKEIYAKFKYSGRILVKLELCNVQGHEFRNTDVDDSFRFNEKEFTINPYPIKRVISLDVLNIESLTTSLFVEVFRACDWTVDESDFHQYIENLKQKLLR